MIDIHTHILPHLDDGAKDTATAVAMLKQLRQQGVDTVVFTPHYYGRKSSPEQFIQRRNASFERLKEQIPEGLTVRLGAELHFTGLNMPGSDALCRLAIEDTKYILVEFPFTTAWTGALLEKLSDFMRETGYTPIVAHVERYREVKKNPSLVSELIHMGCLIQVNAPAFLDRHEKKLAFALLKHGFVHCIGSDAHDMQTRSPNMSTAKDAIIKAGYEEAWARAENIMEDVVCGKQVRVENGKPIKKVLGMYI